jgi:hypothetical protein
MTENKWTLNRIWVESKWGAISGAIITTAIYLGLRLSDPFVYSNIDAITVFEHALVGAVIGMIVGRLGQRIASNILGERAKRAGEIIGGVIGGFVALFVSLFAVAVIVLLVVVILFVKKHWSPIVGGIAAATLLIIFVALMVAASDILFLGDDSNIGINTALIALIATVPGAIGGWLLGGQSAMAGAILGKKANSENGEAVGSFAGGFLGAVVGDLAVVIVFAYVVTALLLP